jgi:hypothetical protein
VLMTYLTVYRCHKHCRNSAQLVEAAFDGDLDEVKNQLDKGNLTRSYKGVCMR